MATFKVIGPVEIDGHKPGETFTVDTSKPFSLNTAALISMGAVERVAEDKEPCPSCLERNIKGAKTKTYTAKQLAEHYEKDHPGLVAPAGEEE